LAKLLNFKSLRQYLHIAVKAVNTVCIGKNIEKIS